jgi:antitoxin component YwqK of YwqJK toxin-antitoxin module
MFDFLKKTKQQPKHPENGLHTEFYKGGKKLSEINYKDGKKDGKGVDWYKNGQKFAEGFYINGMINGKSSMWHKNGQLWYEEYFINGKEDGLSICWYKNGKVEKSEYFIRGVSVLEQGILLTEKECFKILKDGLNDTNLRKNYRPLLQMRVNELSKKYNS